ncbi:hypothetical protein KOI40_12825 [Aestuariicella sp. G3-2]|uniref:hypothetical protein n=1 Tax=Pseudomaricurvus albidus TaxID=2842452 RepID=UPI001C0CB830|nr:hypothetical protein [Aestuariicella albida]MBU3070709.1 hypothetical protein [Aestuariicella albida]
MKNFVRFVVATLIIAIVWVALDFASWFGLEAIFREFKIRPTLYYEITEALRQGRASQLDHVFGQLITAGIFVAIYQGLISPKKIIIAIAYGFLFGLIGKIDEGSFAYTYGALNDPLLLLRVVVAGIEGIVAGILISLVIKE